ncbi:MAG: hypothetical protein L3K08_01510 [Thermoplasmata archaeon]|nr:hypothetical protein [Thermoplasmata archaeon]
MAVRTTGTPVAVDDDLALGRELEERMRAGPTRWAVPVTDLLDPRSAYYRRFAPVPLPTERRRRRSRGTWLHARWVRRMGPSDRVEARVQRDGLVGVVDLLEPDGPTELKTTGWVPAMDRWISERGVYFDQLGLYASLTDSDRGRIVVVSENEEGQRGAPQVALCRFRQRADILGEGAARADRLRRAVLTRDPSSLPRCAWFGRRCPYQESKVCGCSGTEPADDRWIRDRVEAVSEDASAAAQWARAIEAAEADLPPVLLSFSDLVYPRRAYFDRIDPAGPADAGTIDPDSQAAYRNLVTAVESGPVGERGQRPSLSGDPPGSVALFRGAPFLVKTTRAAPPPDPCPPAWLPAHYRDELGFRCASVGTADGWVFLDALRARPPVRGVRALKVHYPDLPERSALFDTRRNALAAALTNHDPSLVPACPAWRFEGCPYRTECGCGTTSPDAPT